VPKTLAVRAPDLWALRVARPMHLLVSLSRPFRQVAQRINSAIINATVPNSLKPRAGAFGQEYQELLELAYQQGRSRSRKRKSFYRYIGLDRQTAKDVMKPRARMSCISDDLSVEEMLAAGP